MEFIDWEDLLIGYNRIYGYEFRSVKEMLSFLYKRYNSLSKVSTVLGTSNTVTFLKLKELDIDTKKNLISKKEQLFKNINYSKMKGMTFIEILKETKFCESRVRFLIKKYKRSYKKFYGKNRRII